VEGVKRAMEQLGAGGQGRLIELPGDIAHPEAVEAMFSKIRRFGRLDVLVNNAVIQGVGPSFPDTTLELFESVLRVNLIGLFHMSREAARMMIAQGGGAIVNIGSNVSKRAIHNRSAYVASKGGVDALTLAMAVDLAPHGIRVNTVAPGYIHTDRWEKLSEAHTQRRRANVPLGKEASAEDVANAVLFLASDEAASITGARLVVDGGCSAQHMPVDIDV
jgi:NAD(P)-dependent dehydrogenase (short-subunit alcohol dehydrogenase family)